MINSENRYNAGSSYDGPRLDKRPHRERCRRPYDTGRKALEGLKHQPQFQKARNLQERQTMVIAPTSRQKTSPKKTSPREEMRASVAAVDGLGRGCSKAKYDITTRQSRKADKNAMTAGALLIASQGKDTGMIVSHPDVRARRLMKSLLKAIASYDPSDKGGQAAMSYIAAQLKKSWSPLKGGVGRYKLPEGTSPQSWNAAWDKLDGIFKAGNSTEEHKQQLIDMCNFFKRQAGSQFSSENHPLVQRVNQMQFVATLGQIMEDFLAKVNPESTKLLETMIESRVMDADSYAIMESSRKRSRANDLLSEVSNKAILAAVVEQLNEQENAAAIKEILKKEIDKGALSDESYEKLIDQVYNRYVEKVSQIISKTWISGGRGRAKGNIANSLVNYVNSKNDSHLPIVMPDYRDNDSAMIAIKALFGSDTEVSAAIKAIENRALDSDFVPKTIIRLNSGLSSALKQKIIDQPGRLLREAAKEIAEEEKKKRNDMSFRRDCRANGRLDLLQQAGEKARVLESFSSRMESPRKDGQGSIPGIKAVLGEFKVPYSTSHDKKTSLKDFAEKKCIAGLIAKHHLRTLCGPSGTTVDSLLGLMTQIGKDGVNQIVAPLFKYVEYLNNPNAFDQNPLDEAGEFKTFFAALSIQMQGGQYHSVAEVLIGMYVVGMALQDLDDDTYFDLEKIRSNVDLLLHDFAAEPGKYFPVTSEDVAKAKRAYQGFIMEEEEESLLQYADSLYPDDELLSDSSSSSEDDELFPIGSAFDDEMPACSSSSDDENRITAEQIFNLLQSGDLAFK